MKNDSLISPIVPMIELKNLKSKDNTFKKKARFNIFAETTVASFGLGYMDYGRIGFMSIDILRWSMI